MWGVVSSVFLCFISTALMASYSCLRVEVNALKTMTDRAQEELVEDPSPMVPIVVTLGWNHRKSSDKFIYPLVVIDVDGLTDWTPGVPWNTTRNHLTVIFRACFRCWNGSCGNSQGLFVLWSQLVWRRLKGFLATRSGLYIALNLSQSTSRSCLSQLPSQSSKLFQTYGKKGETRKYPQRWQPETKRRQKDTNMFFLFENWWAKC